MIYANILTLYADGFNSLVVQELNNLKFQFVLVGNTFFISLKDEKSAGVIYDAVLNLGVMFTLVHIDDPTGCYVGANDLDNETLAKVRFIINKDFHYED